MPDKKDVRIVVLQRGWVFVGEFSQNGPQCTLTNGFNVRRWGTPGKGLGLLAQEGPQSETVLDPVPAVRFHELTVVASLECKEEAWKKTLSK